MINLLKNSFLLNSEKTAFYTSSEQISFGELWQLSKRYANAVCGNKNPVILKGGKQIHMIAGIIACLMVSRPYIPCDENTPPKRIEYIKTISGADIVIDSDFVPDEEQFESFENNDKDTAYIIFTSGSTGFPKGVPVSRKNLKSFIQRLLLKLPAVCEQSGKKVLNTARFSFDLSVADIYFSLCTGSTLCAFDSQLQRNPDDLMKALENCNPNLAVMTPTFAKYCLCMPEFNGRTLSELSCIFFCGEMLEPRTVKKIFERFDGIKIVNAYGPTEATCAVCGIEITSDMCENAILPVGKINLSSCDISVRDGEIILDGDSVFGGYLGAEQLEGSYATGDKGEIRNGYIYCTGRKYGYIKYKGHRIETDEIEKAILSIDGVEQCKVFAVKKPDNSVTGITAKAVSFKLDEKDIKTALCEILPDYMIPKTIEILDKISFNDNGKQNI